jgi:host cell surface-exposed lipoprotein
MKGTCGIVAISIAVAIALGSVTAAQASPISRQQAVREAKDYLQSQAFSFKSLVAQLKYEGFSTSDATYGVSHSGANWFKEAFLDAKDYLGSQAFSRSGLIAQLRYEGFTYAQALYGVQRVGL